MCIMWYQENQICRVKKLDRPVLGTGVMDTVAGTALDMFVHHRLSWVDKKAVEMDRYYGSEALRDKNYKKAIDYALDKLNPIIQNVGSQALDSLSTKIRPKKRIINKQERPWWRKLTRWIVNVWCIWVSVSCRFQKGV